MNIKKSKIVLALSSLLLLSVPLSSAFADENHHGTKEMQQVDTMASIKTELRDYIKSVKADDSQMMQQHVTKLLELAEKANKEVPANITAMSTGSMMDHSKMDMKNMPEMDHSKMDMKSMPEMDHSKMDMKNMPEMDHSKMDMKSMPEMDHSKMDMKSMPEMDHSKMDNEGMNTVNTDHDMSAMPNMEGMSSAQHHQHMIYMQGTEKLQASFKELAKTQDKGEIKVILADVKEHIKKYQLFN
tara:strand:- start:18372 stop:19097 length:726 start_codon:yes stop_codon:yes gene_type:complete